MLFGTSTIFWQRSHGPVVNIFRDSCFKIGQFQPSVAYKSVAYKKKRVCQYNFFQDILGSPEILF